MTYCISCILEDSPVYLLEHTRDEIRVKLNLLYLHLSSLRIKTN